MDSNGLIGSFEDRKKDHIRLALQTQNQAEGLSDLNKIKLIHEALPDLDFSQIKIDVHSVGINFSSPLFISSMTAGHADGFKINKTLAAAAEKMNIAMGVGSQRKELFDSEAAIEWREVRKAAPKAHLFANLGISQLIKTSLSDVKRLTDNLEASGIFVHLNALQEVLQTEGTPEFKGGLKAIENLVKATFLPVIIKEVGCGFSKATLKRLEEAGVKAVDVSGLGGTHWGRIEGHRASEKSDNLQRQMILSMSAETFKDWGISTVESLLNAKESLGRSETWASGGIRTGLDVAKAIALGANMVGLAHPMLKVAIQGEEELLNYIELLNYELKVAMFCCGCESVRELQSKGVWTWTK